MSLGKVIRKYRKIRNLTQEEMAVRLGVTAPAVNKWENENSYPDITLLAPIARLLDISLDTLLSYREDLTAEEINGIIMEADQKLKTGSYEEAFGWARKKLEQYPNCEPLILNLALCLDAYRTIREVPDKAQYDPYLTSLYTRLLDSKDEAIRMSAADSLAGFYMRKKQYDRAEKYLEYFSIQNPERKRKQARSIVQKQAEAAKFFEMGKYYEVSSFLEITALEKDADTVIAAMEEMLSGVEEIESFRNSSLYEHMEFKEIKEEDLEEIKENLRKCFRDEENFGFLKNDSRYQNLIPAAGEKNSPNSRD